MNSRTKRIGGYYYNPYAHREPDLTCLGTRQRGEWVEVWAEVLVADLSLEVGLFPEHRGHRIHR